MIKYVYGLRVVVLKVSNPRGIYTVLLEVIVVYAIVL